MAEEITTTPVEEETDLTYDPVDEQDFDDETEVDPDEPLLQWQTSEPTAPPRPTSWYVIMGLAAAAIIIIAIFTQSWVFIPLGILVPIALTMYGNKGPGEHAYSLEPFGVRVDQKDFAYDAFKSFFVIENKGQTVFELVPLQRLGTLVTLHATAENADEILEILASVLPETQPQGYLGENIFSKLKF